MKYICIQQKRESDLLSVSRIESGRGFKIIKAPADIKDIILKNVNLFQLQTNKHAFKVDTLMIYLR